MGRAYSAGIRLAIGQEAQLVLPDRVFRARISGTLFDPNKCFPLPLAMPALREMFPYHAEHRQCSALVVGHTDRDGNEVYNRYLSEQRAGIVAALLRHDVDAWLAWYAGKESYELWGFHEDKLMAEATDGTRLTAPLDKGARRAMIEAYMGSERLAGRVSLSTHGCGEWHTEVKTADGVGEGRNRRVELFLFDGQPAPSPVAPCKWGGCPEYARWVERCVETVDLSVWKPSRKVTVTRPRWQRAPDAGEELVSVRVELADGRPATGVEVALTAGKQRRFARTDDRGILHAGLAEVPRDARLTLEVPGRGGCIDRSLRFVLPPLDSDEGMIARLAQLGYPAVPSPRYAVAGFQRTHGLALTGRFDEATRETLDQLFGGGDPARTAVGLREGGSSIAALVVGDGADDVQPWLASLPGLRMIAVPGGGDLGAAVAALGRARRLMTDDEMDRSYGGLRGHTLLVVGGGELPALGPALSAGPDEHVLVLWERGVEPAWADALAAETGRAVYFHEDPLHADRDLARLTIGAGDGALGRDWWDGGDERPWLRLVAPPGKLFPGMQRRAR